MKTITRYEALGFFLVGLIFFLIHLTLFFMSLGKDQDLTPIVGSTIPLGVIYIACFFLSGGASSLGFVAELSGGKKLRVGTTVRLLSPIIESPHPGSVDEDVRMVISEIPSRKQLFVDVKYFKEYDSLNVGHTYVWDGEKFANPFTTTRTVPLA